jgi:uncharacterized membrane protein
MSLVAWEQPAFLLVFVMSGVQTLARRPIILMFCVQYFIPNFEFIIHKQRIIWRCITYAAEVVSLTEPVTETKVEIMVE